MQVPPGSEGESISYLSNRLGNAPEGILPAASHLRELAERLQGEQGLVIIFGSELRGTVVWNDLVRFGTEIQGTKFICLGDHSNSRGAADMGVFPDLLPGYVPLSQASRFAEAWNGEIPTNTGLNLLEMFGAASLGNLSALYVVGSNPIRQFGIDPQVLQKTFVIVQDLFLTETASVADVVLPTASAYEKAGTFTNTCGDLQRLRKAADISGRQDRFGSPDVGRHAIGLQPLTASFTGR